MSRSTRFAAAVHVCAVLALEPEGRTTSDFVAGSLNTNPVVVRRILAALKRAGIARSVRGTSGGSTLARRPADITLADIAQAAEAPEAPPLPHRAPNPQCPVGRTIQPILAGILERAEVARLAELRVHTLAEVLARVEHECGTRIFPLTPQGVSS